MKHKIAYWECKCCGLLAVTYDTVDMSQFDCVFCKQEKCKSGGGYVEIKKKDFCKKANIKTKKNRDGRKN